MHKLPLVSVVTPSYNSLPYIIETIQSVHNQDYQAIEHIIVDGNSTDGTQAVLEKQPNLRWCSEPDRGQSEALNKGFRLAQGEIIGWLNSDDTYSHQAVSTAVDFFNKNDSIDLIYGDLQIIDENSNTAGITKAEPFELRKLIFQNFIKQPTVFMRRRVIERLGGVDERLHYVMDRELWLRASQFFKLEYLPGPPLANFRLCPGTKSYEQVPKFRNEWIRVLEYAVNDPLYLMAIPAPVIQQAIRENRAAYHIALMIKASDQHDKKEMLNQLSQSIRLNSGLMKNKGVWFFVGQGLLGIKYNRLKRFNNLPH